MSRAPAASASGADARRVGAHVGDEADRALVAELDAFVEPLRERHRAARREAELARRLLLQARGDERRRRVLAALLALDAGDDPRRRCARRVDERLGRGLVLDAELLRVEPSCRRCWNRPRRERRRTVALERRASIDQYSSGYEGLDLALALADEAHGDRLHAARRQAAAHLVPQDRADLVADQAVEDAARLLRVELVAIELAAGCWIASWTALLGDLVEQDAVDVRLVRRADLSAMCQAMASPSRSGSGAR